MGLTPKISSFFKRGSSSQTEHNVVDSSDHVMLDTPCPTKTQRIETTEIDISSLERDPGLRKQICDYPVNRQDEVRRAYITLLGGPNQPKRKIYPATILSSGARSRRFQASWFDSFRWLEYSLAKNKAFCFPCFLFATRNGSAYAGHMSFVVDGFDSWRKVNSGKDCSFRLHVGANSNSSHQAAELKWKEIRNPTQNIEKVIVNYSAEQVVSNRLRLKTSIDVVRRLAFQPLAFRGHDERASSINRGNFLEFYDLLISYNEEAKMAAIQAPKHATYKSSDIQKEILHIFSSKVKESIREEIGDAKFCIIVDEARDESKKEQMAIVIRFVNQYGFLLERFFGIVHVPNTMAMTLKDSIYAVLNHHNLDIRNIRGQGFDGASNMRGEFNGLQALILSDCPYAYYVHCFAHRLQLALVASAKDVIPVERFFTKLLWIVNIVSVSCKRNDELKAAHADDVAYLISINELETGKGLNQIGSLQRPGDTRWSSHLKSVSSLLNMYSAACLVLLNVYESGHTSQKGEAQSAHEALISFEFVFILHLMNSMLGITDFLCQALQCKTQDILKATGLILSTKNLLQKLRDDKFDDLVGRIKSFCESRNVDIPNMDAQYASRYDRARNNFTVMDHYRVDIFYAAIDSQLNEINRRFNEKVMELLVLSSTLNPCSYSPIFKIDDICELVNKFYPEDFTEFEKRQLSIELHHYENSVVSHVEYKGLSSISELCQWLVKTEWYTTYPLVYRILLLVLTLPVSTATAERSFLAMKLIKTTLRNKMEADYLQDCMMIYIEKEIASKISTDVIIDAFAKASSRRVAFF